MLTLVAYYLPGFKAGGPLRSVESIVRALGGEFEFRVVTRDRDEGDRAPYPSVRVGDWERAGATPVFYASPRAIWSGGVIGVLRETPHDLLYLNSAFSPAFTIAPLVMRRLGILPRRPVIVAPRGEFSSGAIALKARKKRLYLALAKRIGLYRGVIWQASTPAEAEEIRTLFSERAGQPPSVRVAPNLPSATAAASPVRERKPKRAGALRVAFLSRVSRKKNLDGALNALRGTSGDVLFQICGPIGDPAYWQECTTIIDSMPPNICVEYRGPISHDLVGQVLTEQDLLLLPTRGENFGHVILEALAAGCPVLISDKTPWRDLRQRGVGWDLPIDDAAAFHVTLQHCVDMAEDEHCRMSTAASALARQVLGDNGAVDRNRLFFRHALQRGE